MIWILRHLFTSSGLAKISAIFLVYSSLHCFITAKLPVTIWMQRRHHSTICFGFHEAPSPLSGMFRSVTAFFGAAPQVGKRYAARHALTLTRNEIQDLFEFRSTTQNLHFKSLYRKIGVSCVISFLQLQITNKCLPLVCGFVCRLFVFALYIRNRE